ncbi:MAG: glycosyltransferase family 39 protein [Acidimicrobiales bacterium]
MAVNRSISSPPAHLDARRRSMGVYRLPSLLAAAAVPMPTYRLAARRFGPSVATIAVVILAVSYSFVTNAQEARSYTMLAALITWSWLLLDRAIETPSPARWLRWGIVTALTLYAQPLGLPILMGQAIWMLIERRRLVARSVITGFAAAAVISVPFGYLTLFEAGDHTSWLGTFRLRSFAELVAAAFGAQRVSDALVLSAVGTLLAVGFATVALSPRPGNDGGQPTSVSGHKRQLPYVLWVVVPIMVLLVEAHFGRS